MNYEKMSNGRKGILICRWFDDGKICDCPSILEGFCQSKEDKGNSQNRMALPRNRKIELKKYNSYKYNNLFIVFLPCLC